MYKKLSAPASEEKIIRYWKHTDKVYVSVVCPCFNQENYIADALDSFLAQQLDYKFEIVVHDDASTDGTPEILKAYQEKYPSIIRLILQTENQYSQRKQISTIGVSHSKGEYIALCEGDDFWVDELKLQKQLCRMIEEPKFQLCYTAGYGLYGDGSYKDISKFSNTECIVDTSRVIRMGGAGMPTPSLLMKREVIESMPTWFQEAAPVGDFYMQIVGSKPEGALFLPDQTVCYRINAVGSWSSERSKISVSNTLDNMARQENAIRGCLCDWQDESDLKYALSVNLYNTAFTLVINKEYAYVKDLIVCSWNLYPNAHRVQAILYRTRHIPNIATYVFRLYQRLGTKIKARRKSC
ncbi:MULTISPECIES: glycosyltransferase family 2 protein [Vibrio]|uniref:glycosyltransferase family 2 protein n=1 Tax=Vibrio TaxID=662 RepID=UPI001BD6B4FD|nr:MULTISPECIES: glycosyltransferase family 2 protein [Vibrio]MBS9827290.1 glycosyltransferase family 2 protein [Vibrio alginolyticus]MBY7696357.1 glycosyltransferase family 2 protein [Vibrio alginolyticus]MDW1518899.1 glycosyltransferase family 2 protein [Vibrio sp. Vb5032]MDW2001691.1 glycosyltransferase family 2 protein [Vibrio sp. 2304]